MSPRDTIPAPPPSDDEALSAACLLLVQAHRAGNAAIEAVAAAAIALIEARRRKGTRFSVVDATGERGVEFPPLVRFGKCPLEQHVFRRNAVRSRMMKLHVIEDSAGDTLWELAGLLEAVACAFGGAVRPPLVSSDPSSNPRRKVIYRAERGSSSLRPRPGSSPECPRSMHTMQAHVPLLQ